ncbi:MAG: 50S ribosomal protein L10 [Patescibacteria group bacterium]
MPITRDIKGGILKELQEVFDKPGAVFVNFHGLTVSNTSEMRKTLRHDGVKYMVAKKTLIRKVLGDKKVAGELPELPGEIAVVYPVEKDTTDITAPARGVYAFQKKFDGRVSIVGGIFEGAYLTGSKMLEIATIPSQHVLLGMFVNIINSPVQRFAIALQAVADKKSN